MVNCRLESEQRAFFGWVLEEQRTSELKNMFQEGETQILFNVIYMQQYLTSFHLLLI